VTTGGGPVGSPTDLRVHLGGGAWGGTTDDIVLTWKAPIDDYGNLTWNIIYMDTDLSDGFQYTYYWYCAPNSSVAGDDDWCILPVFLTNNLNYTFRVNTTWDLSSQEGGMYENMVGTNVGYRFIMWLYKTGPTLTNFLWISLPYYCDYKKASDIAGIPPFDTNSIIEKVSRWNYTTQTYQHLRYVTFPTPGWEGDDFDIEPGDAIAVTITTSAPYPWSIVGAYDDTLELILVKTEPTLTNFMWLSLPYHRAYQMLSDIAGPPPFDTNSIIEKISQWSYSKQEYEHRRYVTFPTPGWDPDWPIFLSPGDAIAFTITHETGYNWKPEVTDF
jgi:hypothetical protein